MLTKILIEALANMDYDTLEHVLESCNEEELALVDEAMEAVSEKDKAILSRGYKVGDGRNVAEDLDKAGVHLLRKNLPGGKGPSFENLDKYYSNSKKKVTTSAKDLKDVAGDIKVDITRIKNNLKGNGSEVSRILKKAKENEMRKNYKDKTDIIDKKFYSKDGQNFSDIHKKMSYLSDNHIYNSEDGKAKKKELRSEMRKSIKDAAKFNNNSISNKIGSTIRKLKNR